MTSWNLRKHGDRIEKKWRTKIAQHFKMYEPFWSLHVAPLTYRVVSEKDYLGLKSSVADMDAHTLRG